jgi:CheY-like chemotaxis protein
LRFDLLNILLIDDNRHMLILLNEILRAIGVRNIHAAHDGGRALRIIAQNPIDLIMTDLAMEPLDGLDLVRRLRASPDIAHAMIPVIMITGHSTLRRVAEARDAGVNEFLSKPVTTRGLLQRIGMIVDQPRGFVKCNTYVGPDRRRRSEPAYYGPRRRLGDERTAPLSFELE